MNAEVKSRSSKVSDLISKRIDELKGVISQREIADKVGYQNQNIISMIKQGESKLALDRVPAMAKALDLDVKLLMGLALEQFYSRKFVETMIGIFEAPYTDDEIAVLEIIREVAGGGRLSLTDKQKEEIARILKS